MLFLSRSVYEARRQLWSDFEAGKAKDEAIYRRMLELEPHDFVGLVGIGRLRRDAGDLADAEKYFWQAIESHPCLGEPYVDLARILYRVPGSLTLAMGLCELGISKRNLIGPATHRDRTDEPEAVTRELHPLRLIHRMQEDRRLNPETVDAIMAEGSSIVPLLVGVLRGWAQDLLGDDCEIAIENTLALLGETGAPSGISHLLEFVDLEHKQASGAAAWALGRIIERHPQDSAQFIDSIVDEMGSAERLRVAEQILRHPGFDPGAKLFTRLSENLKPMKQAERDAFFPMLLVAMSAAVKSDGVILGRAALRRQQSLLSWTIRRECEDLLAVCEEEGVPRIPVQPSAVNIYDICGGNVAWNEEESPELPGIKPRPFLL